MNYSLNDELLLIRGDHSFLLVAKAGKPFCLCIETSTGEYCQGVEPADIIVVSAPEGGPVEPALMLMDLVRTYHTPLLVLPATHPGSRRILRVVSVAPEIHTSCSINRGTHPEQHLICSSDELAGMTLRGTGEGIEISGLAAAASLQLMKYRIITEHS
jgi:hypothetical protein